ncbi:MAG: DUF664 domain-containing protein [Bacteroidetes bacterium]|nr:DUF664 domain-containing protein [Bacteroidota bacterium]
MNEKRASNRRSFIATSMTTLTGLALFAQSGFAHETTADDDIHIIGPKSGYAPQIGTLVSMMTWMRVTVLRSVEKLNQEQLDFLFDPHSNTIGAMLMHLAATETFYQTNTFIDGFPQDYTEADKKIWDIPMNLGEPARKSIKGHDLKYYTDMLSQVREKTLAEFRKRDDAWLMKVDPKFFAGKPTNNYCKWFHVCEHESNHNGQIKWIAKRLPGVKPGDE